MIDVYNLLYDILHIILWLWFCVRIYEKPIKLYKKCKTAINKIINFNDTNITKQLYKNGLKAKFKIYIKQFIKI